MGALQLALLGLYGTWQYVGFQFDGRFHPAPNPNLIVQFTFFPRGTSRLRWYRTDEPGFCERDADFKFEDGLLYQKIVSVHPENRSDCATDPDMRLGAESTTPVRMETDRLYFVLELDGREFLYIMDRVKKMSPAQTVRSRQYVSNSRSEP